MNNANVRYKDFIFPVNPSEISFSQEASIKNYSLLSGGCTLQNFGRKPKKINGKGSFVGENAFSDFEKLEELFSEKTSGILLISGVAPCFAQFCSLKMLSSSSKDTVNYEFTFIEDIENEAQEDDGKYVYVGRGQNLWHISNACSIPIDKIMSLNPHIATPWTVCQGEKVRIG